MNEHCPGFALHQHHQQGQQDSRVLEEEPEGGLHDYQGASVQSPGEADAGVRKVNLGAVLSEEHQQAGCSTEEGRPLGGQPP